MKKLLVLLMLSPLTVFADCDDTYVTRPMEINYKADFTISYKSGSKSTRYIDASYTTFLTFRENCILKGEEIVLDSIFNIIQNKDEIEKIEIKCINIELNTETIDLTKEILNKVK
jgi:hypothetical protein